MLDGMPIGTGLQNAVIARSKVIMRAARTRVDTLTDISEPKKRTGELHNSKKTRLGGNTFQPSITVQYDAPQAGYTDRGTRRHVIRPRRAKALRFYSRKAGKVVYARRVNHPGNKGTKWFRKAVSISSWRRILKDVTS